MNCGREGRRLGFFDRHQLHDKYPYPDAKKVATLRRCGVALTGAEEREARGTFLDARRIDHDDPNLTL
jgi:hypothetical protein